MTTPEPSQIGRAAPNRRAPHLLRGQGRFVDDVPLEDPLYVGFVRSPCAAGRILEIDPEGALDCAGVIAVHGGAELADLGQLSVNEVIPLDASPGFPVLAQGVVSAVGQPIAAVLAETPAAAAEGAEAVLAEIDEEDGLPSPSQIASQSWQSGDVPGAFARAAHCVEVTLRHPRLAPSPLEPRAIAVAYDPQTQGVTVWHSTQTPHRSRNELAQILGIDRARIRVIAPDVGGAFGMKGSIYPEEVFAVWAAFHHRRNVRWSATRSEDFLSATHGRGVTSWGRLALDGDGRFLALEARVEAPLGRWLPNSALITAWNAARVLPGGYDIGAVDLRTAAMAQNLGPAGIYRGAGRPEANCLMERLVDKAARAAGLDPLEIRRRNLLRADQMPHRTATGNLLDSGDYAALVEKIAQGGRYQAALERRDARRAAGALAGVGIGFYVEPSGSGWESARVTLCEDGSVDLASGSSSQGHGRETALAQIAADVLEVAPQRVRVTQGDTGLCPEGIGALASRSTAIGGSAVMVACQEVMQRRAAGEALPITAEVVYENKGQAWGFGLYLVALEVDRDTGQITLTHCECSDDAGRLINPAQVAGQIRGGFAQGLGEALMERVVYDGDGQLLSGSFMDYALPRAGDVPRLAIETQQTPSPLNVLGAKGVGEAGTIGAPPAILNAALDALAPLGITDLNMPLTPNTMWQAMSAAQQKDKR